VAVGLVGFFLTLFTGYGGYIYRLDKKPEDVVNFVE
jgi:hypothetical protein